jgi:murein DD-endopeptidase MepM/ murein hydrolase activator NlpD
MDRRRAAGAGVLSVAAVVLVVAVGAAAGGSSSGAPESSAAATVVTTDAPGSGLAPIAVIETTGAAVPGPASPRPTASTAAAAAVTTVAGAAPTVAAGGATTTDPSAKPDGELVDEPEGPASAARAGPPPTVALPTPTAKGNGKGQPVRPVNVPFGAQLSCPLDVAFSHSVDWLAPRSGGRVHLGHDLIVPWGSQILAISDGYVRAVDRVNNFDGVHDLGGITITIDTAGGDIFYYAHMSDIDPSLTVGSPIVTGEVLGHSGQTGDAIWSVPHLHLGWRPGRGQWADPYNLVVQLCSGLIVKG